ncbi:MAG: family 78 glycoside hydrolase catalytic domain [Blautia sp.]|nr:family 78 glycoside hydrolase catalytic domain [Blautia sp.]
MHYTIRQIFVETQIEPIGLDIRNPLISWKFSSEEKGMRQSAYHLQVSEEITGDVVWDTGILSLEESAGVCYQGEPLLPETRYAIRLNTWNQKGEKAEAESFFETGLLERKEGWEDAKWIGSPEYYLSAESLSVFSLCTKMKIEKGSAGLVFGAQDERLLDYRKNELGVQGDNHIRYVINTRETPAVLEIYRVGYCREDSYDKPIAVIPLVNFDPELEHTLTIEVTGNKAYAYLDEVKLDEIEKDSWFGKIKTARQLNPLDDHDVTTYPRLCNVGYFVEKGSEAVFDGITIRNIRTPKAVIARIDPDLGKRIKATDEDVMEISDPSSHSMPYFRTRVSWEKEVKSARLYATARGIYNAYIDGRKVGDSYFMPGASQYDRHLMYQTYDVTDFFKAADLPDAKSCTLAFLLSSGWWNDMSTYELLNYNYWGDKPSFMAKLVLVYADGTRQIVISDTENWEYYGEGAVLYSGFFNGEHIDANRRKTDADFFTGQKIDNSKMPVEIDPVYISGIPGPAAFIAGWPDANRGTPVITGSYNAPVVVNEIRTAICTTSPAEGVYVYDFGQELVGIPRIRVSGTKGERMSIRYGEFLYPDLEKYNGLVGWLLQANLREASNHDWMLLSGEGEEVFEPQFTFHGYRYLEISGIASPPKSEDVQTLVLSSVREISGEFNCDHALINQLVSNVNYSMKSNYLSIPTDCPQRNERMGWVGDTHAFCATALKLADVKNFLWRNLQAIRDLQTPDGRLPNIAPMGGGFGGITYESGSLIIADQIYTATGDSRVIAETYPVMDQWMKTMLQMGMPGDAFVGPIDDWLAPEGTDSSLVWNAFYGMDAAYMKKFAGILGRKEEAKAYEALEERVRKFWNERFKGPDGRTMDSKGNLCDSQGSYALGLQCGMFYEEDRPLAAKHLARHTGELGHRVMTGFFGTGALCPMLSANGYHSDAVELIKQTAFPSWLYPVTQGATTIWEHWDSFTMEDGFGENNAMNSFNHYAYGSVVNWCYEYVLGIRCETPGYRTFVLEPRFQGFAKAGGSIETPFGRIESKWENDVYQCIVPENTTAKLILNGEIRTLGSGTYTYQIRRM